MDLLETDPTALTRLASLRARRDVLTVVVVPYQLHVYCTARSQVATESLLSEVYSNDHLLPLLDSIQLRTD
jgi:hypothetical protein